jgi:hypothetical protein
LTSVPSSATVYLTWTTALNSVITVASGAYNVQCPTIGTYLISGKIGLSSALTALSTVALQTSTDGGSSWATQTQYTFGTLASGSDFVFGGTIVTTSVVNQLFHISYVNGMASVMNLNTGAAISQLCFTRIA